jgi:glycosyltransferase involved in cell wall biosynthesis
LEQQHLKANNHFQIVSCSSVISLKRVHIIAEALSLISDLSISWKHFGGGELLQQVAQNTRKLLENSSVKFEFAGEISNEELHRFYASHQVDLFINVSETEGIPVSIMEALSYSIPIIAPNVGGIKEIVNEQNGRLLSSSASPREVADAILYFMNLPPQRMKEYRDNAFRFWSENFNAENNFSAFVNILSEI